MYSTNRQHPRLTGRRRAAGLTAAVLAVGLVAASCGSDDDASDASDAPAGTTADSTAPSDSTAPADSTAPSDTTAGTDAPAGSDAPAGTGSGDEPLLATVDPERCAANQDAGTITYLSGFDFAAAASIIDVIVAEQSGYFDDLCLDVELKPSFATANYTLVGSDQAQFASAGNYTEILNFSGEGAEFVAFIDYGKTPIEALITPDGGATELAELEGKTIGVKGDIPPSIVAMLAGAGLTRGHGLRGGAARRIRSAGASRHRDRCAPRVQVERTRSARCRRRDVQPLRPGRRRHPRHVRPALHVAGLLRRSPDGRRGLRPGVAEGHGGRDRRPGGRRRHVGGDDRRRRQPGLPHQGG